MELKKAKIENRLYNIVKKEEYNPEIHPTTTTAIDNGRGYIVPLRNKTEKEDGFCNSDFIFHIKGNIDKYKEEKLTIIDFNNVDSMRSLIETQDKIKDINKSILENPEDIYVPIYNEDDSSEMRVFKEALAAKQINLKSYETIIEDSTGSSFNNDKRILEKNSISFTKLKNFGDAFGMKITLTIEDKNENIANPMGCIVSKVINEGGPNE